MPDYRPRAPARGRSRVSLRQYLIPVVGGFLGTAVVAALVLLIGRGANTGAAISPASPPPEPVVAAVSATCMRDPSKDSLGQPASYEPERAIDGDPTTAWRCTGDGVGQSITLELAGPAAVDRVGVVPGLAKTDPGDLTDRYAQNRRLVRIRLDTDAGSVQATLDPSATNRAMQYVDLPAMTTRRVTVTIMASVPGSAQNGQDARDTVAISEISVR